MKSTNGLKSMNELAEEVHGKKRGVPDDIYDHLGDNKIMTESKESTQKSFKKQWCKRKIKKNIKCFVPVLIFIVFILISLLYFRDSNEFPIVTALLIKKIR